MKNIQILLLLILMTFGQNRVECYAQSNSKVEIINPEFLCSNKADTRFVLDSVVKGLTCFVNGDIKSMELFLSPQCQEVIKSQKKIFKGRKQVVDHIIDIIKNNKHNRCQLLKFEIHDPCTMFSKDQVVISFVGVEKYITKNKKNIQYKSHITLVLSKDTNSKISTNNQNPYSDYQFLVL